MYSVVMVVAMAGAPEVPSDFCFKDTFCSWKDKWTDKCNWKDKCSLKDYGCAKPACAPVAAKPAPVAVAPAPVAAKAAPCAKPALTDCCDKLKSKTNCLFSLCDKLKGCTNSLSKICDKGSTTPKVACPKVACPKLTCPKLSCHKVATTTKANDCGKSKCSLFSICGKGAVKNCGTVAVPCDAPKKDVPEVDPKGGKVGG
ncbi:MAG: hypothetical protein EXS09_09600 [Gemmataceae bacterium]|nr:hypothetical protein [Gemmataceae bacterium]